MEADGFWPPKRASHVLQIGSESFEGLEQFCKAYLDDVLVFSVSWSQHIYHLNQVFSHLKRANLKLNVAKCQLPNASLEFLGHTLSLNMIQSRKQKVDALLKFPPPKNEETGSVIAGVSRVLPTLSTLLL